MKTLVKLIIVFAIAALAAGCFDYSESIVLNVDGSGTLTQHIEISKAGLDGAMGMLQAFSQDTVKNDSMYSIIKKSEFEAKLAGRPGGVKLVSFNESQTDSIVAYDIKLSFTDFTQAINTIDAMNSTDMVGMPGAEKSASFAKDKSGSWIFSREFGNSAAPQAMEPTEEAMESEKTPTMVPMESDPVTDPMEETAATPSGDEASSAGVDSMAEAVKGSFDEMGKMMEQMIMQAFANHSVKLSVKFPGEIVESNATKVNGREATWEYKLTDVTKAPGKLHAVVKP